MSFWHTQNGKISRKLNSQIRSVDRAFDNGNAISKSEDRTFGLDPEKYCFKVAYELPILTGQGFARSGGVGLKGIVDPFDRDLQECVKEFFSLAVKVKEYKILESLEKDIMTDLKQRLEEISFGLVEETTRYNKTSLEFIAKKKIEKAKSAFFSEYKKIKILKRGSSCPIFEITGKDPKGLYTFRRHPDFRSNLALNELEQKIAKYLSKKLGLE